MIRFTLHRNEDPTGVSGTGIVAEGIEFSDGTVALRWLGDTPSTVLHSSIENVTLIHGHSGSTEVVWED